MFECQKCCLLPLFYIFWRPTEKVILHLVNGVMVPLYCTNKGTLVRYLIWFLLISIFSRHRTLYVNLKRTRYIVWQKNWRNGLVTWHAVARCGCLYPGHGGSHRRAVQHRWRWHHGPHHGGCRYSEPWKGISTFQYRTFVRINKLITLLTWQASHSLYYMPGLWFCLFHQCYPLAPVSSHFSLFILSHPLFLFFLHYILIIFGISVWRVFLRKE